MKPFFLLLLFLSIQEAFAQEIKEYAQKGYWRGWLYTDSARRYQFSTETGDSVVNHSDGKDVNVSVYRKDVRITIRTFGYGHDNLEIFARKTREELGEKFPEGATNAKQGKLKHDEEHYTYYYTRRYAHNGRKYCMLVAFRLMGSGYYDVAMTTALFYDDEQADVHEAAALKTAEGVSPI